MVSRSGSYGLAVAFPALCETSVPQSLPGGMTAFVHPTLLGQADMRVLHGEVTRGYGLATRNLAHVASLIAARTGLARFTAGTLNVRLPEPYLVAAEATVTAEEYDGHEHLKLQRCVVYHGARARRGIRAVIVRPHKHEVVPGWAHGPSHAELVSAVHLRRALALYDGAPLRIEVDGGWAWWAWAGNGNAHLLKATVGRSAQRVFERVFQRVLWPARPAIRERLVQTAGRSTARAGAASSPSSDSGSATNS